MSKRKTLRRLSSAALLSLAMYSQTMGPGWVREVKALEGNQTRIEKRVETRNKTGDFSIGRGRVQIVEDMSIIVRRNKDGKDINVLIDEKTKILDRSLERVSLNEVKPGDEVSVAGKLFGGDAATIKAGLIRNLSYGERKGVFKGVVLAVENTNIVLRLKGEKVVTVPTLGMSLTNRNAGIISLSDFRVGDRIRVKGVYDGGLVMNPSQVTNLSIPRY